MKRRSVIAAFAASALVLAACGGDDDSADTPVTDPASADASSEMSSSDMMSSDEMSSSDMMSSDEMSSSDMMSSDEMSSSDMMSSSEGMADHEGWPDSLVFTLTPSQEAGGLVDTAQPLADALSDALGLPVKAIVPSDYAGVIVALQSGQAQVAGGLGPAQMVLAADTAGADLALQAVRFGSSQYVTQWYTNNPDEYCADAPVANEDGLLFCNGVDQATDATDGPIGLDMLPKVAGKNVAFVDQGSTSGFQIPALELLDAGVDPFDDITPVFAGGHDSAIQAVYDGDAEVGVSFNDARTLLTETVPDVGEKVVVFGWSDPIPNDGFAIAGDLPDDLKQAITDALLAYADTEDGAATLSELYEIDGLVPVPDGSYDVIRDLQTKLGDRLG